MTESYFTKNKDIAKELITAELKRHEDSKLIQLFEKIFEWQKDGGTKLIEEQIIIILNEILEGGAADNQTKP